STREWCRNNARKQRRSTHRSFARARLSDHEQPGRVRSLPGGIEVGSGYGSRGD
ncbi:hypothetical protein L195_g064753, partial [Trifolium pratense]